MIQIIFDYLNLDYKEFISVDEEILKKNEPKVIVSNPIKIKSDIGWESSTVFDDMVIRCIDYKLTM